MFEQVTFLLQVCCFVYFSLGITYFHQTFTSHAYHTMVHW